MQQHSDDAHSPDSEYSPPELRRLGAVEEVTRTTANITFGNDGGPGGADYPS